MTLTQVPSSQPPYSSIDELRWHILYLRSRIPATKQEDSPIKLIVETLLQSLEAELQIPVVPFDRSSFLHYEKPIRRLYKLIGLLRSLDRWHSSPSQIDMETLDLTPLHVFPGYNDYDRGYLPQALHYEAHFKQFYSHLKADRAFLFSCGMGSIQTALQIIIQPGIVLAIGKRVYHETQLLVSKFSIQSTLTIVPFDETREEDAYILQVLEQVDVLFIDSCTLGIDSRVVNIERIFALSALVQKHITIIIDNTLMGPCLRCVPPPTNTTVLLLESLIKYYQLGLDLASSGIMVVINNKDSHFYKNVETLRGTNGTNVNPSTVELLPLVPRDLIERRMERHQLNAALIHQHITNFCTTGHVKYGGLLFLAHNQAKTVSNMLFYLSIARNIPLIGGTSFGFNTTRISLVDGDDGAPQIRVACGTETSEEAQRIATMMSDVLLALQNTFIHQMIKDIHAFFPAYYQRSFASNDELSTLRTYALELDHLVQGHIMALQEK